MKFDPPRMSSRWVVVGKTGTGKSRRVKDILRQWGERGVRIVAIDVCDEYSREGQPRHGMECDGTLRQRVTFKALLANPALLKDARLSLSVVPNDRSPRSMAHTFVTVLAMLREIGKPVVLVVDETARWADPSADRGLKPNRCLQARTELEACATMDRKNGIALVVVSQSAAHIPIDVRRQSDTWLCFLQDDPSDLEAMEMRLGKEKAAEVSRLGLYAFEVWRDSTHAAPTKGLKAV